MKDLKLTLTHLKNESTIVLKYVNARMELRISYKEGEPLGELPDGPLPFDYERLNSGANRVAFYSDDTEWVVTVDAWFGASRRR